MFIDIQRIKRERGFTLIELMIVVAILGILAAIAIPAMSRWMTRSKTAEAPVQIGKMFDATVAYFQKEHVDVGETAFLGAGGAITDRVPHRCPHQPADDAQTQANLTPAIAVRCSDGPGGRCVPAVGAGGDGYYEMTFWTDNAVWTGLNFQQEQGHFFHYNFQALNDGNTDAYGRCQFTAQAFADFDGDDIFSTFERTGAADRNGVNAAAGLYISRELE